MRVIDFLIGIHNHQPVGNFGHVFEESFEMCYEPQLLLLDAHPGVRMAVHHSGPLLEWIEENRPGYIDTLARLAERGQVEILSGGFYEPILSSLPEGDAVGQIEMMNDYVKKRFGYAPRGMWAAERIWDPTLPRIISRAGLEYTLLDDTHFHYAGLEPGQMFGYYMTEKHGHTAAVFPIDKSLRYSIPFKLPEETIGYIKHAAENLGARGVTYGDDGEKFGVWPGTHKWVYEEKWLDNFYTALEENADTINMAHFSEFLDAHPASGRVYLPMASYEEMSEWTLDAGAAERFERALHEIDGMGKREEWKPFIRGGVWDNFLAKYEESNRMHKKMLYVSGKLADAEADGEAPAKTLGYARRELYRGQCNCAYWHGLFGGLYLNYLRHAVYSHLIKAENLIDKATHKAKTWVELEKTDFNASGAEDIVIRNPGVSLLIEPGYGGCVSLFDYRPAAFSLTNTLTRRKEAYHAKILESADNSGDEGQPASIHDIVRSKEANLDDYLIYDDHVRHCFQDHLLTPGSTMMDFMRGQAHLAGDITRESYEIIRAEASKDSARVELRHEGIVLTSGGGQPLTITKEFTVGARNAETEAVYKLVNGGTAEAVFWFGVEFNLTLLAADAEDRYWTGPGMNGKPRLKETGEDTDVTWVGMRDDWSGIEIKISSDGPFTAWRFPVETVSQSESGFERTYQGSCVTAVRPVKIGPGKSSSFKITLSAEKTK